MKYQYLDWFHPTDPEVKIVYSHNEKQWLVLVYCNFNGVSNWGIYNSFEDLQSAIDWAMIPINVQ